MKTVSSLLMLAVLSCTAQSTKQAPQKVSPGAALAVVAPPNGSKVEPVCDSGSAIQRASLDDWRHELEAAFEREDGTPRSPAQRAKIKSLFAEIGVEIPDERISPTKPAEGAYGSCAPIELGSIQISDAKLTDKESHKLIEINLSVCNEAMLLNTEETILSVLSIAPGGGFCEVGQLSSQWISQACLAPASLDAQEKPMSVTAINLLSSAHQDLQIIEEDGHCYSVEREGRFTTSLWTVRDGELTEIFSIQSFFAAYNSPTPPSQWTEATITMSGAFPKELQVQEEVVCEPLGAEALPPEPREGAPCKPSKVKGVWRFDGEVYSTSTPKKS